MKLIEIYIQEVTRRLPEKSRDDIVLELRSTIEDMLPDDYTEQDVKVVLEKLGNPATLSSGYSDRPQHLIGPRYFDIYKTILKMGLPIAALVVFIAFIAGEVTGFTGEEAVLNVMLTIITQGFVKLLDVCLQVFFWTTLTFAVVERFDPSKDQQPLTLNWKKWTPDDLEDIPYLEKKRMISKVEVFGGLFWTAVWATVYFYADHLVGIYEGGNKGIVFVTPVFNQEVLQMYWPAVIAVIILEILLSIYKLYETKWTLKLSLFNTALQIIFTVVFVVIVNNSNLFHAEFIDYINAIFNDGWESWLKGVATITFILGAVFNAYDGFRKAKQ